MCRRDMAQFTQDLLDKIWEKGLKDSKYNCKHPTPILAV